MKKLLPIVFLLATLPALAQNKDYTDHRGSVVDAATGKPLPNATVTHSIEGKSDEKGRFTIRYYNSDTDLRVIVSHPGFCTDTFNYAPTFVRLRRISASTQKGRPKVAVVLSGGGAKGVAHIEALRAIEEAGLPIDMICGTSMGSLVGALYCYGYSVDFLDSLIRHQDWTSLLSDRTDPSTLNLTQRREQNTYALIRGLSAERTEVGGLIRGRNLMRLFRQLLADHLDSISFDSLPIPFACVATDLVTNTEIDFRSGYLPRAMRASMAIPGVFTPVRMGDSVLVDGGLRNNFPTDLARAMGADVIIGVTVQGDPLTADDLSGAATVMNQIIDINTKDKYLQNVALCDVLMKVDVSGYSAASFTSSAIDSLLRRGAEEAARHRDELLHLRRSLGIDSLTLRHQDARMADTPPALQHRPVSSRSVSSIPIASVGFRFDTEEMGAIQLAIKAPLPVRLPMGVAAVVRLGRQLRLGTELTLLPRLFTSPTISYDYRRQELDVYREGLRSYNVKYRQHTADFSPFNFRFRNFTFRGGLQWEYYDYYGRLLTAEGVAADLTDDQYLSYHFSADLNSENHWYFPSRGTRLHLSAAYRTDNLVTLDGGPGMAEAMLHLRVNASSGRFTLQPMLAARVVLADDVPPAFRNALGPEWYAHSVDQQMPFPGIGSLEYVERHFAALHLQLQYRILNNHYLLLRTAAGIHRDTLGFPTADDLILGIQAGYSYMTLFGPIDLRIGWSSRTSKPALYLNLGHAF